MRIRYPLFTLIGVPLSFLGSFFVPFPYVHADILGDTHSFFVDKSFDEEGRSQLTATLRSVSKYLYLYTDDSYWNKISPSQHDSLVKRMELLGSEFDSSIYPRETEFWGSEPRPGVDNDTRITLLLENMIQGNGGYFDSTHSYPLEPGRQSNERDMISLNFDALPTEFMRVFLGHEFQHLISANQKDVLRNVSEDVWLNELRSEYSATLLDQNTPYDSSNLSRRTQTFLRVPSESLTEWAGISADYGITAVFAEYVTGRFGARVLSESMKSSLSGIASLDNFFAQNGIPDRFSDTFADWMIASYLNDPVSIRYSYARPELRAIRVQPAIQRTLFSGADTVTTIPSKYWQPTWSEFTVGDTSATAIKMTISSQIAELPLARVLVTYWDGTYDVRRVNFSEAISTLVIPLVNESGKKTQKVVLTATYGHVTSGFSNNLPSYNFIVNSSLVDALMYETIKALEVTDEEPGEGSLIKRNNSEPETYVILGNYKRYLRPEIIALYGHLDLTRVIPVDSTTFDRYRISNYVRSGNDRRVYAVWPDGTKHWLNISGERFTSSGRDWNAIFVINDSELNAYRTGADITQ